MGPGADPIQPHFTKTTQTHPMTGQRVEHEPQEHLTEAEAREHADRLSRKPGHVVEVHNADGHIDTYIDGETQKARSERQIG